MTYGICFANISEHRDGALLNQHCRFYDKRIGQSTTLSGRQIVKHMSAHLNEAICGEYDHTGDAIIYGDTDSVVGSTIIRTNKGDVQIGELFDSCSEFWEDGTKQYAGDDGLLVMSYHSERQEPYFGHVEYIYRHQVSKSLYEIEDANGNTITVTEDHSIMVERDGNLIEVKPTDINPTDILISLRHKLNS
jgi:DNA polymerase elongation subunit (family B)